MDLRARLAEFDAMHGERIYWNDVCWAFDAVERVLDLPDADDLRGLMAVSAEGRGYVIGYNAALASVRAALLGES